MKEMKAPVAGNRPDLKNVPCAFSELDGM